MASRVSNRFFATNVKDGKSVSAIMRSNMVLAQQVVGSGACAPNWDADEVQMGEFPQIWVWTRLAGNTTAIDTSSVKWLWNGTEIEFNAAGESQAPFVVTSGNTTKPLFQLGIPEDVDFPTAKEGGVSMPTLYIVKNIGSHAQATDNNTLTMTGSFVVTGSSLDFSVNTSVRVQESSGSGYFGTLTGIPRLTDDATSTTLSARLYNGSSSVPNFYTEWFLEGNPTRFAYGSTTNGKVDKSVSTSQIVDNAVIRVEFYDTSSKTEHRATALMSVDDETDTMELQVTSIVFESDGSQIGSGQGDVMLRSGQEVQWTFWMGHRQDPSAPYTAYTKFFVKLTDNEGNVLAKTAFPTLTGVETTPATLADHMGSAALTGDDKFINVTLASKLTPSTAPVSAECFGGRIKCSYDYIGQHGDGIGGIILAV